VVKAEIAQLKAKYNKVPGIAFIGFTNFALAKYTIPLHIQLRLPSLMSLHAMLGPSNPWAWPL
jgi:hypothetical protein